MITQTYTSKQTVRTRETSVYKYSKAAIACYVISLITQREERGTVRWTSLLWLSIILHCSSCSSERSAFKAPLDRHTQPPFPSTTHADTPIGSWGRRAAFRRYCLYRLVQKAQREEMEPTAAVAHTRLADSGIPEPTGEAAVMDASAREIQKERQRGEGTRQRKVRGGAMGRLTSFPGLRPAILPAWTKTASSSPCLPSP